MGGAQLRRSARNEIVLRNFRHALLVSGGSGQGRICALRFPWPPWRRWLLLFGACGFGGSPQAVGPTGVSFRGPCGWRIKRRERCLPGLGLARDWEVRKVKEGVFSAPAVTCSFAVSEDNSGGWRGPGKDWPLPGTELLLPSGRRPRFPETCCGLPTGTLVPALSDLIWGWRGMG